MCRFTAYLGEPVSASDVVFGGAHSLYRQSWAPRELLSGSVNADGYGVVWYAGDRPGRIAEVRPIWYDTELRSTLSTIESHCVVAALRNGTPGLPVDRAGLLPLVRDGWAFVLNGFVPDFRAAHMRALRETLPDRLYASLAGSSDAETLFLMTLASLDDGVAPHEALCETARRVHARVRPTEAQFNMLLTDGRSLAAVRSGTVLVTNSLYVAEHPPFAPGGVVVASEPPEAGACWAPVDGHSWIAVDRDGGLRSDLLFLD